jgi:hypothetical protein
VGNVGWLAEDAADGGINSSVLCRIWGVSCIYYGESLLFLEQPTVRGSGYLGETGCFEEITGDL